MSAERMRAFTRELDALCRRHHVVIAGTEDDIVVVNTERDVDANGYDLPRPFDGILGFIREPGAVASFRLAAPGPFGMVVPGDSEKVDEESV